MIFKIWFIKLIGISPDSKTDESSFYSLKIKANDYKFDEHSPILIGMTANVNILTGKRTVLYYLIKPMKDMVKHGTLNNKL